MALASPSQLADRKHLLFLGDMVLTCQRLKKTEHMKFFANEYQKLDHRIRTHDYTAEDKHYWLSPPHA